jgi:Icc protein
MPNQSPHIPDRPLSVVQITDTHLFADEAGELAGVRTWDSFRSTLALARSRHWPPDLVLATGDLVHDGSAAGYRALQREFAGLNVPVYCLSGNHDEGPKLLESLNGGQVSAADFALHGPWGFVFVDTNVPGSNGGHLGAAALQRLRSSLDALAGRHGMVCLHHQPVPVGSRWLDTMQLDNGHALFELLGNYPNVRCLLWGHVHQEFDRQWNGLRLLACPSTCIQFTPESEDFSLDCRPPGYRWLHLYPDGRIDTGVQRLPEPVGSPDLHSGGY